jgi:glutaconate CoA-transferase subunit B
VAKPKVQLLGVRGIPGNTINHPCSFFVPDHSRRVFVERVDMVSGVGHDPRRWAPGVRQDFRDLRLVVTNLAVLDFGGPEHAMRVRSLHPGVPLDQVQEQTVRARGRGRRRETRPTTEQPTSFAILDPHDLRARVFA